MVALRQSVRAQPMKLLGLIRLFGDTVLLFDSAARITKRKDRVRVPTPLTL